MTTPEIWQSRIVADKTCLSLSIGMLRVWVANHANEWHTAYHHGETPADAWEIHENAEIPEGLEWRRWVKPVKQDTLQFAPGLPDRPAVIRPQHLLHIPKHRKSDFFVGIPICLKIQTGDASDLTIFNEPVVKLSNIWFGEMETGELGFTVDSAIRTGIEELAPFSYKAVCPVDISNEAEGHLEIRRICIQVKHLSLYQGQTQLWTNKVKMEYRGGDNQSEIDIRDGAPNIENTAVEISKPKEPLAGSFTRRTFRSWKNLSSLLS